MKLGRPPVDFDFSLLSYQAANKWFVDEFGVPPQVLLVGPGNLTNAYRFNTQFGSTVSVVCVPGMGETWAFIAPQGVYLSLGG